jgi:hypothetical protein
MTEANICQEPVNLKAGGTEERYRSDGFFTLDGDPADVLRAMLAACDGWISENADGTLALKVGKYRAPAAGTELTGDHIRGFTVRKGVPEHELVTELVPQYVEPELDYTEAPVQPWRDEAAISATGKVRSQPLPLPWVRSHSQARRLAKRKMAQLNARLTGSLVCTLYALRYLGERWIRVQAPELADFADLVIENLGMTIDLMTQTVTLRFGSVNPNEIDAWDPATEEGDRPAIPAKLITPLPPVPANPDYVIAGLAVVRWDNTGRTDISIQGRWRLGVGAWTEGAVVPPAQISVVGAQQQVDVIHLTLAGAGAGFEWQIRSVNPGGAPESNWSVGFTPS